MPTKNSRKIYAPNSYYHVYTRGNNKQVIFKDQQDYAVLLGHLKRYLSTEPAKKNNRQSARSFADDIDLLCYCLMPNHIHLLVYQYANEKALQHLLQRVFTSYSMYFNRRYEHFGPVFQSRYLSSRIDNDPYLYHISRYIHRNPKFWNNYDFSSLKFYTGERDSDWVKPGAIMDLFDNNIERYLDFLSNMSEDDEQSISAIVAHR